MGTLSSAIANRNWELAAWTIVYTAAQLRRCPSPSLVSSPILKLETRSSKMEAAK